MPQDDKARALQIINQYTDAGGLNVAALCDHLSRIVMTFPYTVFEIFNILTERQFSQSDHEWVCRDLISRINLANLALLAASIHGQILLERIQYILNCQFNIGDQTCGYIAAANVRAKELEAKNYCGVNPVTGKYGLRKDKPMGGFRLGGLGNIRPGHGGPGGYRERRDGGHSGVDIVAPVGTPVVVSNSGKVIKIVRKFELAYTSKERSEQNGGYGNAVTIKYNVGIYGYYAHLTSISIEEGDVRQGDVIGTAGRTGNANNKEQPPGDDHLH